MIEFKEWYKYFDEYIRHSDLNEQDLLRLYKKYEGYSKGINLKEYTAFMNEVFGAA